VQTIDIFPREFQHRGIGLVAAGHSDRAGQRAAIPSAESEV